MGRGLGRQSRKLPRARRHRRAHAARRPRRKRRRSEGRARLWQTLPGRRPRGDVADAGQSGRRLQRLGAAMNEFIGAGFGEISLDVEGGNGQQQSTTTDLDKGVSIKDFYAYM